MTRYLAPKPRFGKRYRSWVVALALCVALNDSEAESPDSNEAKLKDCMARIELVAPVTPQPDFDACLQTAGDRQPAPEPLDVRSLPAPKKLPDGRKYIIVGATQRDIHAELKDYPDEAAIRHVGDELRRLACEKGSDAIYKAAITCGLCPDRVEMVPCVFAQGYFVVWVEP